MILSYYYCNNALCLYGSTSVVDIQFVILLQARWSQLYPAAVRHIYLFANYDVIPKSLTVFFFCEQDIS